VGLGTRFGVPGTRCQIVVKRNSLDEVNEVTNRKRCWRILTRQRAHHHPVAQREVGISETFRVHFLLCFCWC